METIIPQKQAQKQLSVVESLRQEANKNPAFNAVAHVFAIRQRARQQVTIQRLTVSMAEEGYTFSRKQLEEVLKFLAACNLGTLEHTSKGRVRALKNIKVTLQSIGRAALATKDTFDPYTVANRFIKIPTSKTEESVDFAMTTPVRTPPPFKPLEKHKARQYEAAMTVTVDGEDIKFALPKKVTMEQFFKILAGLYEQV